MAGQLFAAAIGAANPGLAVRRHLASHTLPDVAGHTYVIAIGKAAPAMLKEALRRVAGPVTALAVTHHENTDSVDGATVLRAGHPVPDAAGLDAARQIIGLLSQTTAQDHVLALISGGGSALIPAPVAPLTLADKQAVSRALLGAGLDIGAMNLVRQQLSQLKGGGFLHHAAPAPVTALILSDVIGNDLRAIASGPTTSPLGTRGDAVEILEKAGIFQDLPENAKTVLRSTANTAPLPAAQNHLIGSNRISLEAMCAAVPPAYTCRIVSDALIGDVSDAAAQIVAAAQASAGQGPTALIFGGETTVRLLGNGRGGRNQELALRVAVNGVSLPDGWIFLSGGTDGRDGPTDAAGGITDGGTLSRIAKAGLDTSAVLANNDSYAALFAADDLLMTGATGTNVADVQVMLLP